MSSNNTVLCRELKLIKQHRCSYTGGQAVHSRAGHEWIACLNNGEVTFLSTKRGEVIVNVNAVGEFLQTPSPLIKSIKNSHQQDDILHFNLSKNDELMAISTRQRFIRVLRLIHNNEGDLEGLTVVSEWKVALKAMVRQLLFHRNNDLLIGGTGNGALLGWNVQNGHLIHKDYKLHLLPITTMKVNPFQPNEVITGSQDTYIKVYDLRSKTHKDLSKHHNSTVMDLQFMSHQKRQLMLSIAAEDCIVIWDLQKYSKVALINNGHDLRQMMPLSHNLILCGDGIGMVHFYRMQPPKPSTKKRKKKSTLTLRELKRQQKRLCHDAIRSVQRANNTEFMVTTLDGNFHFCSLQIYDDDDDDDVEEEEEGKMDLVENRVLIGYNDEMLDVSMLDADHAVIVGNSNNVKVLNVHNFGFRLFAGHSDTIMSVAVDPEYQLIASASKDTTVRFWNAANGECVAVGMSHRASVHCVAHIVSNIFISGSADGKLKLWDLADCVETKGAHRTAVAAIDVSVGHHFVASCAFDGKINLFKFDRESNTLEMANEFKCDKRSRMINAVRFSKHDKLLASAHGNGEIKLWKLPDFICVKTLQSREAVLDVMFINYSTQILSSSSNGIIRVWSLRDEQCVATHRNHYDKIWRIIPMLKSDGNDGGEEKDRYLSIGCDSILNIWEDHTVAVEKEATAKKHEVAINKTKINNFIHNGQWKNAIKLCLQLNQPQKLFRILLSRFNEIGDERMADIVTSLDADELGLLMTLLIDFNTGSTKFCYVAQSMLHLIYSRFDLGDIIKLEVNRTHVNEKQGVVDLSVPEIMVSDRRQNFAQCNSALMAYSKRHLQRVDKLLMNLSILDFVTQ